MTKTMKVLLSGVLCLAFLVMIVLGLNVHKDQNRLRELEQQLSESRAAWEKTAEEKEILQAELQEVQEAVKEAALTLEESTARAAELREDIAELQTEIDEIH